MLLIRERQNFVEASSSIKVKSGVSLNIINYLYRGYIKVNLTIVVRWGNILMDKRTLNEYSMSHPLAQSC